MLQDVVRYRVTSQCTEGSCGPDVRNLVSKMRIEQYDRGLIGRQVVDCRLVLVSTGHTWLKEVIAGGIHRSSHVRVKRLIRVYIQVLPRGYIVLNVSNNFIFGCKPHRAPTRFDLRCGSSCSEDRGSPEASERE